MKSKLLSLIPMTFLFAACCFQTACETTLAAKNPPNSTAMTGTSTAGGTCARQANHRSDCDDAVGCFWNYETSACVSH